MTRIASTKWPAYRLVRAPLATLLLLALACTDAGTEPQPDTVVANVAIEPAQLSLVEGETRSLAAVAKDATGRILSGRTVTWTTSDASVASVSSAGAVTALSLGTVSVRASIATKFAEAHLTVTAPAVDRVELSPATVTLVEGESRALTALAKDAAGRALTGRLMLWRSSDPSIVDVDATGRLTAITSGLADVTVTVEGRSATAGVTVHRAAVAWIGISPTALVLEIGETRQLQAVLKDALGNVLTGRAVLWSVDNANVTISPAGLLTGARQGYVTITATSEGISTSTAGTIVDAAGYDYDLVYNRISANGASEIFILTLGAGAAPVRLNAGTVSRTPSPSPDGSRIAFAVSMNELGTGARIDDIFAVDRTGLHMKRLTTAAGADDQPAWSPAGDRIAFHHWEVDARSDIWLMNPDGSGQVNLTADMPAAGFRSSPAWTRDGTRIAFAQFESGSAGTTASIWTMNADGSNKRQVTSTLSGFDAAPSWSPDGSRIAFVRYFAGDADITIVDSSGGNIVRIPLAGRQSSPVWSPDGALIAYAQDDIGRSNIYSMQPNGTRVRLRTTDPAWGGGLAPAWITRP